MDGDDAKSARGVSAEETKRRRRTLKGQHAAAARHSRKHREAMREAGMPTGRQIDTAIAAFLLRAIARPKGLRATAQHLPHLAGRLIHQEGWRADSEKIRQAVDARIQRLVDQGGSKTLA